MMSKTKLFLDTDIGTDCDDAFALVYALKNPRADLVGLSTVQEHYNYRAKIARKILRLAKREISITIGEDGQDKYWTGIETNVLTAGEMIEPIPRLDFPDYTCDVTLAAIGPLTNIANQITKNPSIKNVKNLYVMGSSNDSHNFKVDIASKEIVFNQDWNIYQITKEVSQKIAFNKEELEKLAVNPIENMLYQSALDWLTLTKRHYAWMYDVLAVSAALNEGYVKFKQESENRFVSCGVDPNLKDKLLETILYAS